MKTLLVAVAFLLSCSLTFAANLASDNAADAAYDDNWDTGDNGGSGFGSWTINTAGNTAHWIGTSTNNGGPPTPNEGIDTSGRSFGSWAQDNGALFEAYRSFGGGALSVGQTFKISLDNGWVEPGGSLGVGLQNSNGESLWEWYFGGGAGNYTNAAFGGPTDSGYAYTERGLTLAFTLTGSTSFSLAVTSPQNGTTNYSGHLMSAASGQSVDRFRIFNYDTANSSHHDFFANSMEVVPEPGTLALVGTALISLLLFRRRR